ncbi:hypothetical protein BGZ63DRAFT_395458 [Mariannaea sp. PMI_226]|nr:hypothetical protein BGZ63DRAFT_395458 [Mariannaea sp. PMI_226]
MVQTNPSSQSPQPTPLLLWCAPKGRPPLQRKKVVPKAGMMGGRGADYAYEISSNLRSLMEFFYILSRSIHSPFCLATHKNLLRTFVGGVPGYESLALSHAPPANFFRPSVNSSTPPLPLLMTRPLTYSDL